MSRIELICMPFADLSYPSFGLSQIRSVIKNEFGSKIEVNIRYLNHELAGFLGKEMYNTIDMVGNGKKNGLELDNVTIGLKEWLFRKLAFDIEDNAEQYLNNFLHLSKEKIKVILQIRMMINSFLTMCIEKYRLDNADIVGFCSMFDQHTASAALSKKIKEMNSNIITFIGGCKCTYPATVEWINNIPAFDYVFSGPGLLSIKKFVSLYLQNNYAGLIDIQGVFSKRTIEKINKESIFNKKDLFGEDDNFKLVSELEYDDFFDSIRNNLREYSIRPILFFETSKGCWWAEKNRCSFCDVNGYQDKYVVMPEDKAKDYLNNLSKYDECAMFWATDSTIPLVYLDKVFPYIKDNFKGKKIFYEVRADIPKDTLQKMYKNNIRYVQVGIESLATNCLRLMHKGTNSFCNLIFLKNALECGIHVLWNLLSGIPFEAEADYVNMLSIISDITHFPPPSGIWAISYQRNSEYQRHPENYNLELIPKITPNNFIYPFEKSNLENISYLFENNDSGKIYTMKKIKLIQKISYAIDKWKKRWMNCKDTPKLYIEKDTVVDTRGKKELLYQLTQKEKAFLMSISEYPLSLSEIAKKNCLDLVEANSCLEILRKKSFVYCEDGRIISLVCVNKPKLNRAFIPETIDDILQEDIILVEKSTD